MKAVTTLLLMLLVACTLTQAARHAKTASIVVQDIPEAGLAADEVDDDDEMQNDGPADDTIPDGSVSRKNPCNAKHCQRGEECILRDEIPKCVCRSRCNHVTNPRHKVCGSRNTTFDSECHLDREACLCKANSPQCSSPAFRKLKLNYFGECQELARCDDNGMGQFPERMEGWLAVIMNTMNARHQLGQYQDLLVPSDELHQRVNAVIWKFCDLDVQPQDRRVSRKELQLIIASLRPMEPCLVPFINKCDANNDRKISLEEWGTCLGLERNEIVDKCKHLLKRTGRN